MYKLFFTSLYIRYTEKENYFILLVFKYSYYDLKRISIKTYFIFENSLFQ